jgi:histidine triad (HIT) family protein|tara:strand:+ start:328 stop:1158 length:831 start_codon:yes stop_codon:yes gene_type:complete
MTEQEQVEQNCVFCKIVKGEVPSHKVYEDDKIIVILDIYPAAKGHLLVVPKEHTPIMPLMSAETSKKLFRNLKQLMKGVKEGTPASDCRVFIANGATAGQQSPHFLLHLIPKEEGDNLLDIPSNDLSQEELFEPLKTKLQKPRQPIQTTSKPSKKDLAKVIEQNQWLKEKIINEPSLVKSELEKNPNLKTLFEGVDIEKLSEKLKESNKPTENNKQEEQKDNKETIEEKEETTTEEEKPKETTEPAKIEETTEETTKKERKNDVSLLDKVANMFTK